MIVAIVVGGLATWAAAATAAAFTLAAAIRRADTEQTAHRAAAGTWTERA